MIDGSLQSQTCPTLRDLYKFSVGKMSERSLEAIADHIGICPVCLQLMRRLESQHSEMALLLDDGDSNLDHELRALLCDLKAGRDGSISSASFATPSPDFYSEQDGSRVTEIDQYELGTLLGEGAMGSVYRGWHKHLKKHVVVKLLSPDRRMDEASIARFMREMEAVGRLGDHPHIIRAVDAGSDNGEYFIVMEFVEGCDLRRVLKRQGRLNYRDVAEIGRQLALALSHIREHRMVHRDIKPSNIFLSRTGTIKLMDLGLALFQRRDTITESKAHIVGTADYIAPEQWTPEMTVDGRADLYALGCTMFELVIGTPPFDRYRGFSNKKHAHTRIEAAALSDLDNAIPQQLGAIVGRLLAKRPRDRFDDPKDLAQALEHLASGANLIGLSAEANDDNRDTLSNATEPTEVYVERYEDAQQSTNRRRMLNTIFGAGGSALALAAIGMYIQNRRLLSANSQAPVPQFHREFSWGSTQGSSFAYNAARNVLTATTPKGILGMSWHEVPRKNHFVLSVRIRHTAEKGDVGLFWGGHSSRLYGFDAATQHILVLDPTARRENGVSLRHRELNITRRPDGGEGILEAGGSAIVNLKLPIVSPCDLVIEIRDGRLARVECNGVLAPGIVAGAASSPSSRSGACGVFVRDCSAAFENFQLRDASDSL